MFGGRLDASDASEPTAPLGDSQNAGRLRSLGLLSSASSMTILMGGLFLSVFCKPIFNECFFFWEPCDRRALCFFTNRADRFVKVFRNLALVFTQVLYTNLLLGCDPEPGVDRGPAIAHALKLAHAAQFARLDVDVTKLAGALPCNPRLALPGPASFSAII